MALSITHTFVSAKSDGADATLVQPSNWNATHTITAAAGKVLGRDTSGSGAVQELPIAVDSSGNVGIGGSPSGSYKLEVSSNINLYSFSAIPAFYIVSYSAAGYQPARMTMTRRSAAGGATPDFSSIGDIRWDGSDSTGAYAAFASIEAQIGANASGGASTDLIFYVAPSGGTFTERMRLSGTGCLGINVAPSGTYALEVSGSTNTTTLYEAGVPVPQYGQTYALARAFDMP